MDGIYNTYGDPIKGYRVFGIQTSKENINEETLEN
jgi:hypothetical protein